MPATLSRFSPNVQRHDYRALRAALEDIGPNVVVAVDDAGAGFSSLRHILELRPAFAKLDISLVRGIDSDDLRQVLAAGLNYYALRTGCQIIAEGVETQAESDTLQRLGIEFGQGYLYGRPEPLGLGTPALVGSTRHGARHSWSTTSLHEGQRHVPRYARGSPSARTGMVRTIRIQRFACRCSSRGFCSPRTRKRAAWITADLRQCAGASVHDTDHLFYCVASSPVGRRSSIDAVATVPPTRRARSWSRVTSASACNCVSATYSAS